MFKKYIPDLDHAIVIEPTEVTDDLVYEEHPVLILNRRIKQLRNKKIPLVKVLLTNHTSSDATWEIEEEMKAKYPHLVEVILLVLTKFICFADGNL